MSPLYLILDNRQVIRNLGQWFFSLKKLDFHLFFIPKTPRKYPLKLDKSIHTLE